MVGREPLRVSAQHRASLREHFEVRGYPRSHTDPLLAGEHSHLARIPLASPAVMLSQVHQLPIQSGVLQVNDHSR